MTRYGMIRPHLNENIPRIVTPKQTNRMYQDYVYGKCYYMNTWKNKEQYLRSKDKAEIGYDVSRHTIAYVKIKKMKI